MRRLIQTLLTFSMLMPTHLAFADGDGLAGAILVSFVASRALVGVQMSNLEQYELSEWKGSEGTSTQLADACGFITESRLLAFPSTNVLSLIIRNNSGQTKSMNPMEIEYRFGDGSRRRPDLFRFNKVYFEHDRYYQMFLPFPEKELFKGQKSLQVSIPVKSGNQTCEILLNMKRDTNTPDDYRTWLTRRVFETSLVVGASNVVGDLSKVANWSPTAAGLNMNFWGPMASGFNLNFVVNSQNKIKTATAQTLGASVDSKAQLTNWGIGYIHRNFIDEYQFWNWSVGLNATSMTIKSSDSSFNKTYSSAGISTGLEYQTTFSKVRQGAWAGNYYWGATMAIYSNGNLKDSDRNEFKNTSGGQLVLGLQMGVGY